MWHKHLSVEVAAEFECLSVWQSMQLDPRRVSRPYGGAVESDTDIRLAAKRSHQARYAATEKGRATIAAWTRSEAGQQSTRRRNTKRDPEKLRAKWRRQWEQRKARMA